MEIDKGCLQPSVFDDSIFGENIGSSWELAVKINVSQNRCRVFRKSPWLNLSCDDDVWLREQATMNRGQNSFVDEHLEQYSQHTRQCKYDQQRYTTCLIKAESLFWISVTHQIVSLMQFVNT